MGLAAVKQAATRSLSTCPSPGIQTTEPGNRASQPSDPATGTRRAEEKSVSLTAKPYPASGLISIGSNFGAQWPRDLPIWNTQGR